MVTIDSETSWPQLEAKIRRLPLLYKRDGEVIYPYADATISLKDVTYKATRSTSLYVAKELLEIQRQIAKDIGPKYDPLAMNCGLLLSGIDKNGNPTLTGYIPPIVEETDEQGLYLVDGSHRANIGLREGRESFRAIHITGFRNDCPFYAYPNDWSEVTAYDTVPGRELRKRYKYSGDKMYALYRDFGSLNGSKPRDI